MVLGILGVVFLLMILMVWIFRNSGNVTCPKDQIMLIYKHAKNRDQYEVIAQGTSFLWPGSQYEFIQLEQFENQLEINATSKDNDKMRVPLNISYRMGKRDGLAEKVVKLVLGKNRDQIKKLVEEIIESILQKEINAYTVEQIYSNQFLPIDVGIKQKIETALNDIGFVVDKIFIRMISDRREKERLEKEALIAQSEIEERNKKLQKEKKQRGVIHYPEYEDVFSGDLAIYKKFLFPYYTIDLGEIRKEWSNRKIHLLDFNEDPYFEYRSQFFNKYCRDCRIGFYLKDNKYEFMTDMRYFEVSEDWKEYLEETRKGYALQKEWHHARPKKDNTEIKMGGTPDWWQSDETPIDPDGVPMIFISEIGVDERKQFLFYSPKHEIAVQIYQIT